MPVWEHGSDSGGALEETALPFDGEDAGSVVPLGEHRRSAATLSRAMPHAVRTLRILVAGADPDDHEVLRELLQLSEAHRFRCEWASDATAALRRLTAASFDVCIATDMLSERQGLEFVRTAQRRGFRTPMILLADELPAEDCQEAIELGIADFIEREELDTGRLERSILLAIARRRAADRLDQLAQHDDLTGLAKRALFNDRLERALASARRHRSFVAVMVLDLNGFKAINDRLGHQTGDEILRSVADRLKSRVRETDTVARLGGDEFALVVENLARPEHAALVARKLLDVLAPPARLAGGEVPVSTALGVALYPRDGSEPSALLRLADAAMYEAKTLGGSACRFHDERLDQRMRRGTILVHDLHEALQRQEFVLHFQPQVTLSSPMVGIAAVLRWQHPSLGLVDIDRFRGLAEENGLMEPLTEWLVDAACLQARDWAGLGLGPLHIALPLLSRRQLAWTALSERMVEQLSRLGLGRTAIELEIDERLLLEELEAGGQALAGMAEAGIRIAVEGFGAGPASLRLLRDVPLATIKLSPDLLQGTPRDNHRTLFASAVIRLGKQLGLRVVVEGVEDNEQLGLLRQEGCDAVQSFISCPPLPPEACVRWLKEAHGRGARTTGSEPVDRPGPIG